MENNQNNGNNNEKREHQGGNKGGHHNHHRNNRRRNGKGYNKKPKSKPENALTENADEDNAQAEPAAEASQQPRESRESRHERRESQGNKRKMDEQAEEFGSGFVPEPEPERKYMFDYEPLPADEKEEEAKTIEVVGIKFRNGSKIYYFSPLDIKFEKGEHAIVETVRGVEYGEVALGNKMVGESEVVFPLKPVLRKATKEDDERNAENRKLEESARPIWHEKVAKNGLDMQLVDVEYTHDNAKLCFYFTADGRVDFRELVKDLAGVFRT